MFVWKAYLEHGRQGATQELPRRGKTDRWNLIKERGIVLALLVLKCCFVVCRLMTTTSTYCIIFLFQFLCPGRCRRVDGWTTPTSAFPLSWLLEWQWLSSLLIGESDHFGNCVRKRAIGIFSLTVFFLLDFINSRKINDVKNRNLGLVPPDI